MDSVRPPAVAGTFYPSDPAALKAAVRGYLDAAAPRDVAAPQILIGPHAGYAYSGPIAGSAYRALVPHAARYQRVVLVGPSHRVWFKGIAVPSVSAFGTPLGNVPVCVDSVRDKPHLVVDDEPHRLEHGLEVHLPFLSAVLGRYQLVPLVVGDCAGDAVADVLRGFVDDPGTLIVVSTDLSHFLTHAAARVRDRATATSIDALDGDTIGPTDACGWLPLRGALAVARQAGLQIERLDLRDSSDTAGGPQRVVGYGAWSLGRA